MTEAVQSGAVSESRYTSYLRLYEMSAQYRDWENKYETVSFHDAPCVYCNKQDTRGRLSMRWGRRFLWGCTAIGAGVVILLALILPAGFWWFLFGAALIGLGIWYIRCC